MTPDAVPWGGLQTRLAPWALGGATLRDATPWPVLDTEPWRARAFYDSSPFEFSADEREWRPNPGLQRILDAEPSGPWLEVGCGGGRNVASLSQLPGDGVAIDQSLESLTRVVRRSGIRGARASALGLPFRDESFDLVVCDGVAHHTGDAHRAIAEVARVAAPGAQLYLALYRADSPYELAYSAIGGALRTFTSGAVQTRAGGLASAADALAFGAYRAASRVVKAGRTADPDALRNIYDDYFLTPVASFHRRDELTGLLERLGCEVEDIEPYKNVWSIRARRVREPS